MQGPLFVKRVAHLAPILYLAPMDGVMDALMRHMILQYRGFVECTSEFIRVSDSVLPKHVFLKHCPELETSCSATGGIPVRIQLLGSNPQLMAQNALRALEYGAKSIDLNFGCPSKTVNKSRGGAYLLQFPDAIGDIVSTVRKAIGDDISLSAKMRLGYDHTNDAINIARRIEDAGANMLTIHARTKQQGYKPPALWENIKTIRKHVHIPIIANGDIFTAKDALRCQQVTGCDHLMIGRGALMRPNLAEMISADAPMLHWLQIIKLLLDYGDISFAQGTSQYYARRIKQWLRYLMLAYPEATNLFEHIKTILDPQKIYQYLGDNL